VRRSLAALWRTVTTQARLVLALLPCLLVLSPSGAEASTAAGWGGNFHGQLGLGYTSNLQLAPASAVGLTGVKELASGDGFGIALLSDGTVRTWGGDTYGELGIGSHETSAVPVNPGLTNVTAVSAAGGHAMALLAGGTVMVWGADIYGELGNGTSGKGSEKCGCNSLVPIPVPGISTAIAIHAGGPTDFALLRNGTLLAWGANHQGQIGDGTTEEKTVPTPVMHLSNVVAIAGAGNAVETGHALALLSNGTVMAWGSNAYGQLGAPAAPEITTEPVPVPGLVNVVQLAAGAYQSVARMGDGTVKAWGSDFGGAVGREKCGRFIVIACSRVPLLVGVKHATNISAGYGFSDAVSEGRAFDWGHNVYGQLGTGTIADSVTPVEVKGLAAVTSLAAGQHQNMAIVEAPPTPPAVEVVPGKGSLTMIWRAPELGNPWALGWRPVTRPISRWLNRVGNVPAAARSYTMSGLQSGVRYQIYVQSKGFAPKVAAGVPL